MEKNLTILDYGTQEEEDINCPVHKNQCKVFKVGSIDGELIGEPAPYDYHRKFI